MKKLFPAIAIATIMASCSSDETIDVVAKVPITFGNAFVENATRAANPNDDTWTNSNLEAFKVYGTVTGNGNTVNIYNGDEVTGTVGNSNWNCVKTQYWVPGSIYQFIALVDADKNKDVTIDGNTKTISNSVQSDGNGMPTYIKYDVRTQGDLLLASASRDLSKNNETGAVNFSFNHLLSRAYFTFTNEFGKDSGVTFEVQDIKVTGVSQNGDYTISSKDWNSLDNNGILNFGNSEKISPNGGKSTCGYRFLIPGTYKRIKIEFTIVHELGGTKPSLEAELVDFELKAGHCYNFTATLNPDNVGGIKKIQFNIIPADDWSEDLDKNDDNNPDTNPDGSQDTDADIQY